MSTCNMAQKFVKITNETHVLLTNLKLISETTS